MLLYKDIYLFKISCSEFICFRENLKIMANICLKISEKSCKNCLLNYSKEEEKKPSNLFLKLSFESLVKTNKYLGELKIKYFF